MNCPKRFTFALSAMAFVLAANTASSTPTRKPDVLMRSKDALSTLAINTHINYLDTSYANLPEVINALNYLGIKEVRELSPTPWFSGAAPIGYYTRYLDLGFHIDFVAPGGHVDLQKSLDPVVELAKRTPGQIAALEGFNEVDHAPITYGGANGPEAAVAAQKALYAFVKHQPALKNVPVYDLTGLPAFPDSLVGRANFANAHLYPQNGYPPDGYFRGVKGLIGAHALPIITSEFGYSSLPESGWLVIGVDEIGQAKGILSGIMSGVELGYTKTYIYELLDEKADEKGNNRELHFGLFTSDFKTKVAAKAVHNLALLLDDPSPQARTFPLKRAMVTITGLPDEKLDAGPDTGLGCGHSVILEKSDGTLLIVLWTEQLYWDNVTAKPKPTLTFPVHIDLDGKNRAVALYDPLVSDAPIQTFAPSQSLNVNVPDHPIVLQLLSDSK